MQTIKKRGLKLRQRFQRYRQTPCTHITSKSPRHRREHQLSLLCTFLNFGDFLKARMKLTLLYLYVFNSVLCHRQTNFYKVFNMYVPPGLNLVSKRHGCRHHKDTIISNKRKRRAKNQWKKDGALACTYIDIGSRH